MGLSNPVPIRLLLPMKVMLMRDKYTGDFEVWFDLSFSLDTVVTLNVKRLDSKVPRFEVSGPIGNADSISEIALTVI